MEDIPQPADEAYEVGDTVQVYLSETDPDSHHNRKTGTVVDILEDDLGNETERGLDSLSYRIEVDGREIDIWFRHRDLVPESG